jgi:hypothetical protein
VEYDSTRRFTKKIHIMELKGKYKLAYTIDKIPSDLILDVELKMVEGMYKPGRNIWEGVASLNGQPYTKENLSHCVNAKVAAERIGRKLRDELKEKSKKDGTSFRVKKEEVI